MIAARRGIAANNEYQSAKKSRDEVEGQLNGARKSLQDAQTSLKGYQTSEAAVKKELADAQAREKYLIDLDKKLEETAKPLPTLAVSPVVISVLFLHSRHFLLQAKVATCIHNVNQAFTSAKGVQDSIAITSAQENIKELLSHLGIQVKGPVGQVDGAGFKTIDMGITTVH